MFFCLCFTYNQFKCVMMCCTGVLCVVFASTLVSMCASIQNEKFNCICMNCGTLIHNLFNLVGIYSNLE